MNVIVETTLEVEACWLPELTNHLTTVVPVEYILRKIADCEQTSKVGLSTREEATKVAVILHVSFVGVHFDSTVETRRVRHGSVG